MKKKFSTQLMKWVNGEMKFTTPTFHELGEKDISKYCQFLSDATQTKVRMTYAIDGNVSTHNGHYFSPNAMAQCNGNCNPSAMSYDQNCLLHGYIN